MASQLTTQLQEFLTAAEVLVSPERRGRDPNPGRPDSVLWLRPEGLPIDYVVPILIELEGEGNYHNSKQDVKEFAARHIPENRPGADDFRYHIEIPTVSPTDSLTWSLSNEYPAAAPLDLPVQYELFTIPSQSVTGERSTSDGRLHQALRDRYYDEYRARESPPGFGGTAESICHGETELVLWHVNWRLPGANSGTIAAPFVVKAGDNVEQVLRSVVGPIRLPVMAVLDGSPKERDESYRYNTGVRFPPLAPTSILPVSELTSTEANHI